MEGVCYNHVKLNYSIDRLLDDIVILSVARGTYNDGAIVLARYLVSCGGDIDCTSSSCFTRVAFDLGYKLAPIRCCVCSGKDNRFLPSLLLALSQHSNTGTLNIIQPSTENNDNIESLSQILLGKYRQYPKIMSCTIPASSSTWWKVYQDEFILIHARRFDNNQSSSLKRTTSQSSSDSDDDSDGSNEREEDSSDDSSESESDDNDEEGISSKENSIVYIASFLLQQKMKRSLVIVPSFELMKYICMDESLPEECDIRNNKFDYVLYSNPKNKHISEKISRYASQILLLPQKQEGEDGEQTILIRATQQLKLLHTFLPCAFPMTMDTLDKMENRNNFVCPERGKTPIQNKEITTILSLFTGMSIHLPTNTNTNSNNMMIPLDLKLPILKKYIEKYETAELTIRSNEQLQNDIKAIQQSFTANTIHQSCFQDDENEIDLDSVPLEEETTTDRSLLIPTARNDNEDENEIDLDCILEEEGEDETIIPTVINHNNQHSIDKKDSPLNKRPRLTYTDDKSHMSYLDMTKAHLLVLGTGCATPSPMRGSSGYALFLPTSKDCLECMVLIDCGEGTLRHLKKYGDSVFQQIRFIWISHGHYDHYGDVPWLLQHIKEVGGRVSSCQCFNDTYCTCRLPPLVIAPKRVLNFINISLRTQSYSPQNNYSYCQSCNHQQSPWFHGITQDQFQNTSLPWVSKYRQMIFQHAVQYKEKTYFPFQASKSIKVEHCPDSYALVLFIENYWEMDGISSTFRLIYSGDTRPSYNLVRNFHKMSHPNNDDITLLVHEATFDDTKQQEAVKKKHCTVTEALQIANQIHPHCYRLLSHFSQRYLPGMDLLSSSTQRQYATMAYDGMILPLTRSALSSFQLLHSTILKLLQQEHDTKANDMSNSFVH